MHNYLHMQYLVKKEKKKEKDNTLLGRGKANMSNTSTARESLFLSEINQY